MSSLLATPCHVMWCRVCDVVLYFCIGTHLKGDLAASDSSAVSLLFCNCDVVSGSSMSSAWSNRRQDPEHLSCFGGDMVYRAMPPHQWMCSGTYRYACRYSICVGEFIFILYVYDTSK